MTLDTWCERGEGEGFHSCIFTRVGKAREIAFECFIVVVAVQTKVREARARSILWSARSSVLFVKRLICGCEGRLLYYSSSPTWLNLNLGHTQPSTNNVTWTRRQIMDLSELLIRLFIKQDANSSVFVV